MLNRYLWVIAAGLTLAATSLSAASPQSLPGLTASAKIIRDVDGLAHVQARNEHDMFFLQGWVHAEDRLFQMDLSRRQADGTIAEVLGPAALPGDVQQRTIGLHRAAARSWAAILADADAGDPVSVGSRDALLAYAEGVNAFLAATGSNLPPEYGALGLTSVRAWTPVDSVAIGKLIAAGLSFGLGDINNSINLGTYQAVLGPAAGSALFFEDLFRSQPFDPASTVPDSGGDGDLGPPNPKGPMKPKALGAAPAGSQPVPSINPKAVEMGRRFLEKATASPFLKTVIENDPAARGSNNWGVTPEKSATGNPIIANDPHLALNHPTTFYPMQISSPGYDAVGNGFAGTPFVITGQNRFIAWGPTTNPMDVTDVFQDQVVPDGSSPSGLSIVLPGGALGQIIPIPEQYFVNVSGNVIPAPPDPSIPPATLTVPARYDGVIVDFDTATGAALTVQYTGFGPTRELEAFYLWNFARNLADFRRGLERFDVGSQNWAYADRWGNLGYFTSAEMPIRTDLEAGAPALGIPPYFIRVGSLAAHQWLPQQNSYPGQTTPFEILAPEEMPQVVNPVNGFFVNANNDPAGTTLDNNPLNQLRPTGGIFYLNPGYAQGFRAGSITERVQRALSTGDQKLSVEEMADIQADVGLLDAEYFAPKLIDAYQAGLAPGADPALAAAASDPRLGDAVARLTAWADLDYQAKTGIPEGYDSEDLDGDPAGSLDADEIAASVATTVYSVFRSSFIQGTIDAALGGLPRPGSSEAVTALKNLVENGGVSSSGLDFFAAGSAADQATKVQEVMLLSLSDALNRLAGAEFTAAFANSTDIDDYRWGKLHRIVFDSPLGGPFNVPPAFGLFPDPLPGLPGVPTDGGFGVVDASSHNARATGVNGFRFGSGPTNRWVADVGRSGPKSQSVWPGGTSAIPGDEFYVFPMLPRWLTNDANPIRFKSGDLRKGTSSVTKFKP
jgi:penicillin amidase